MQNSSSVTTKDAQVQQPTQNAQFLVDSPDRWVKFNVRTVSTLAMLAGFVILLYLGHWAVFALVIALQIGVLKEIMDIRVKKLQVQEKSKPPRKNIKGLDDLIILFKLQDVYFYVTFNYFIIGRLLMTRYKVYFMSNEVLAYLARHHSMICFWLFAIGFVGFVLTLKKGNYKLQFTQLAWTLMTLLIVVGQSSVHVYNILEGLIWFFLPCGLVVANDIFAFIWGFFFGRTPLIQLSPKKTWEGFIGAIFSTWLIGFLASWVAAQIPLLYCPREEFLHFNMNCIPNDIFVYSRYNLPAHVISALSYIGITKTHVFLYPFQLHVLVLATFASFIAPFGGFFASGFKRAFKIKDFGESIPGHGGVTDRMDCQMIMALFTFVYLVNIVKSYATVESVMNTIFTLDFDAQLEVYRQLQEVLQARGAI